MSENRKDYGILLTPEIKLHRQYFKECVKLLGINARATKERIAITDATIEIDSLESLNQLTRELRKVDSVYEVNRKNRGKE